MKKRIITIITAVLVIIATLGGCSCTGAYALAFNNDITKELSVADREVYVYDVESVTEYGGHFKKSTEVDDDLLKIEIHGQYTVTLEVLNSGATEIKNLDIKSDILTDLANPTGILKENDRIYKLTSNLEIETKYDSTIDFPDPHNKGKYVDTLKDYEYIRSTVYFLPISYSFNPIYSTTKGHTSFIDLSNNGLGIGYSYYNTEVIYNFNSYTATSEYADNEALTDSQKTTGAYNYSFKSLIDNNMLLFAIRNISFADTDEYVIPTVHPTYGVYQPLSITAGASSYDYEHKDSGEKIKAKEYSIVRNVQNYTGSPQFAVVQQDKTDNLANKTLLLEYAAPISSLSSFVCLGGLKYTLKLN